MTAWRGRLLGAGSAFALTSLACIVAGPAGLCGAAQAAPATTRLEAPVTVSEPLRVTTELDAVVREMARARRGLALAGSVEPYAIRVTLARATFLHVEASYGGVLVSEVDVDAAAEVEMRVGSRERDSTRLFGTGARTVGDIPLRPDADGTARALWSLMDEAYKGAAASLDARERAEAALTEAATPVPDWSPPPVIERASLVTMVPCVRDSEARQGSLADGAALQRAEVLTRALSRLASDTPGVLFSSVKLRAVASTHLDLDTDGLLRCEPRDGLALTIVARGRAEDGQRLAEGGVLHLGADALRDPAGFEALERAGRALVTDVLTRVQAQRTMARLEEVYDGPVVLGAEAAAQLLATMVAPHASGSPAPLSEYGPVEDMRPRWLDQLGQRVLPSWTSLVDAPDLPGGFGSYGVDVEGVSPQALTLVRDGVLEGLLMTRQPNAEVSSSNGRARGTLALGRGPAISNLRLEVAATRPRRSQQALEAEALARAREDGYDYVLVVEAFDDPSVLGPPLVDEATGYGTGGRVDLPPPSRLVQVFADGRRVPLRSALLAPASLRVLRKIREVGEETSPHRFRIPPGVSGGLNAALGADALLTQTVDVQVQAPALLVEGLEVLPVRGAPPREPWLPHPLQR